MYQQRYSEDPGSKLKRENTSPIVDYRRSQSTLDFEEESSFTLQRNASVMLTDSYDRNNISTEISNQNTRVMDKKKMTDNDAAFIKRNDFKKNHECHVCKHPVGKSGKNRHHCRICASTVCGPCSRRRINEKRVCDTCFYKKMVEAQEARTKEVLDKKDGVWRDKKSELNLKKQECEKEKDKNRRYEAQIVQEGYQHEAAMDNLNKEKYKYANNRNKAKDVNQNLKANIEKNKTLIAEKESKLRSLQTKLATLRLSTQQKTQKHKEMLENFQGLLEKHRVLLEGKNESVISDVTNSTSTIIVRNYSLLGEGKDKKYNISLQPVKICGYLETVCFCTSEEFRRLCVAMWPHDLL